MTDKRIDLTELEINEDGSFQIVNSGLDSSELDYMKYNGRSSDNNTCNNTSDCNNTHNMTQCTNSGSCDSTLNWTSCSTDKPK